MAAAGSSAAAPASRKPRRTWLIVLIVVIVLVVVAAAGGFCWWFFTQRDSGTDTGGSQAATSSESASGGASDDAGKSSDKAGDKSTGTSSDKTDGKSAACTSAPGAAVSSYRADGTSLVVDLDLESTCADKNVAFSADGVKFTIKDDDGNVIAAAIYDFSDDPVSFSKGKGQVSLAFDSRQYWRPAGQIDDTKIVVQTGQSADGGAAADVGEAHGGASIADADADAQRYAQLALNWQVKHDASRAGDFMTTLTTQLSSKNYGMEADGKTWTYADIYEQFLDRVSRHHNALMVWASDWPTYTKNGHASDYYVILSGESFGSVDDANAWCTANGYAAADCLAVDLQ